MAVGRTLGDAWAGAGMGDAGGCLKVGGGVKYWSDTHESWIDARRGGGGAVSSTAATPTSAGKARRKGGDDVSLGWVGLVWLGWVGLV